MCWVGVHQWVKDPARVFEDSAVTQPSIKGTRSGWRRVPGTKVPG